MRAQEEDDTFLMSSFVSAAVNHCRTLGYHRLSERAATSSRAATDPENTRRLFWSVYIMDKTLCLLLGRASCLQDFEIDALQPALSIDPGRRPWDENFVSALELARIQGRIYDQLYSPSALKAAKEQRANIIMALEKDLDDWRAHQASVSTPEICLPLSLNNITD